MSFSLRLIYGGVAATVFGVVWFVSGLAGEDLLGIFTGGVWKGPMLTIAGVGAVIMGMRMWRDED